MSKANSWDSTLSKTAGLFNLSKEITKAHLHFIMAILAIEEWKTGPGMESFESFVTDKRF